MRRLLLLPLILLCIASPVRADDLAEIRTLLEPLRAPTSDEAQGVKTVFSPIKKHLRAWLESRLEGFPVDGNAGAFSLSLNRDLAKAGLICGEPKLGKTTDCASQGEDSLGFLRRIAIRKVAADQPFLLLTTSLGMRNCRHDDSAYLYRRDGVRWRRVWGHERLDMPVTETLDNAKISAPRAEDGRRLLLVYGLTPDCVSIWPQVNYGLWLVGEDETAQSPLGTWSEEAAGGHDDLILGRVTTSEALVQFHVRGMPITFDLEVNDRYALRRIAVEGNHVKRVRREALGPIGALQDYLEEHQPYLRAVAHGYPLRHCGKDRSIWEFPLHHGELGKDNRPNLYGWFRWQGVNRFELLGFGLEPRQDCQGAGDDDSADLPPPLH